MKGRGCPALRYASDGDSNTSEPSALSYLNRIARSVRPYYWGFCNILIALFLFTESYYGGETFPLHSIQIK